MSALTWDGWEPAAEEEAEVDGEPVLADGHYLRGALRRGRVAFAAAGLAGLLLAVGVLVLLPPAHRATTLLVLAHDPLVDPSRAMETDLSLAGTRAVAQRTIDELGLAGTPEDLLDRIEVTPGLADTAELRMTAPSDAEAVRQLNGYTTAFLAIRSAQTTAQADSLAEGSQKRITELRAQADALTASIDTSAPTDDAGSAVLGDLIGQRSQLIAQIGSLEQVLEEAQLRSASVVAASRVVDPPSAEPPAGVVRTTLILATGLIGGAGLGVAVVLGMALTSTRLRRRDEVGLALGVPVTVSVGRLRSGRRWTAPIRLASRVFRHLVRLDQADAPSPEERGPDTQRRRLARAVERQFPARGWRQRLVVGCIDNAPEVALALAELALELRRRGLQVHLVDLSERGVLAAALAEVAGAAGAAGQDSQKGEAEELPTVLRPSDVPSLSEGPRALTDADSIDVAQLTFPAPGHSVLVLADLHPAVGADHLSAWAERVVVAVTAGRSSAERVGGCGRMLRAAGLEIGAAVLLHADPTDESYGPAAESVRTSR